MVDLDLTGSSKDEALDQICDHFLAPIGHSRLAKHRKQRADQLLVGCGQSHSRLRFEVRHKHPDLGDERVFGRAH
ncbi:MAG: hypothetical protein ACRDNS_23945, partial [Trebonia sp.]